MKICVVSKLTKYTVIVSKILEKEIKEVNTVHQRIYSLDIKKEDICFLIVTKMS